MAEKDKRTPVFDWEARDFAVNQGQVQVVTGSAAVAQVILKAVNTVRGRYLIYAKPGTPNANHVYGSDVENIRVKAGLTEATRISEVTRAIYDALIFLPWVLGVYSISVVRAGTDKMQVDASVKTIFDQVVNVEGVLVDG